MGENVILLNQIAKISIHIYIYINTSNLKKKLEVGGWGGNRTRKSRCVFIPTCHGSLLSAGVG